MDVIIKQLGISDYSETFDKMRAFTQQRGADTPDELWITEHYPVFTQGQAGKPEHLLTPSPIPVVQSDRGGQVTYHGPGQLVLYYLVDIRRRNIGVRQMVSLIENTAIALLAEFQVDAFAKADAPGVYLHHDGVDKKIASLGLRVRNGRTYHGIALNVGMDLAPFSQINPCGYQGLPMTQLCDHVTAPSNLQNRVALQFAYLAKQHLIEA